MQPYKYGTLRLAAVPRLLGTLGLCLSSALASNAHATLVGDSVTATLSAPNGFVGDPPLSNLSGTDTVTVGAGQEISAGNGDIGNNFMLAGEFIDFQAASISLRANCGMVVSGNCVTGYASGAKYTFSDLDDSAGTITGFTLSSSFFQNFDANWVSFIDAHTISVALDTMQFQDQGNGEANNFGLLTINLIVTPNIRPPLNEAPEPNSLALALVAALALAGVARNRKA